MGFVAAILSYVINDFLLANLSVEVATYARYIAPVIEEILKASFIIYTIRKKKIGFMVDAAIYGFAIGAGFAFIENIYYLNVIESSNIFLWIIRGFGTAVMHGGTTAIFSILTKNLFDRSDKVKILYYIPGLISAILIHSFFNHLLLPAIAITILSSSYFLMLTLL
jgi:RsiW-degrading membrane proteinase PrsW (M82 family)